MSFKNKLILSFTGVYLIWGSTYLALKFGLEGFPPLLLGGIRYSIAGLIFLLFSFIKNEQKPTLKDWKNGLILGFIMNFCGQALTFISAQHVPSSIVALIAATVPLWVTFFDRLFFSKQKLSILAYVGLVLGFVGVTALITPDTNTKFNYLLILPILFSCMCWALGSILPKKMSLSSATFSNLGIQLFSGSMFFLIASYFMGEFSRFEIAHVTNKSLFALAYLTIFGSVLVFSCFNWLIKNYDAAKVSTYGFVNPLVAIILGTYFGNEPITPKVIVSASIILFGVMIIILSKTKKNISFKKDIKKLSYEYK